MAESAYDLDQWNSDHMAEILRISREEYLSKQNGSVPISGPSEVTSVGGPLRLRKYELSKQISGVDAEIREYDDDIRRLQQLRGSRAAKRARLLKELQDMHDGLAKGKGMVPIDCIDYTMDGFDWSQALKLRMKKVFGIESFRLCQQGVCNANMDGRDIVCVMPTGGGKSLTYQLPALLTPGCTLVISPLISLITDQILHLREAGVEAVMLTGATPVTEVDEIRANLFALANKGVGLVKDIKLCYVTPERIAKSRVFMSVLEELAGAGKLARIVVDEAHCVSQLGHDFRPDYAKLSRLRQVFPHVPIMAVSATCPPRVLEDLITILRLKAVVDGTSAKTEGTVYFSSPLYRKNLHYRVLPKSSNANISIQTMVDYILDHHAGESGIVYCLSKKDSELVAKGLNTLSDGKIQTGVYHADIDDRNKELLHKQWRKGTVKVVCATTAFGLGIDKGDVRFVLHHSMSKSLDGFYQESGRAGRDGKDSDCILYYRAQDATRLRSFMCAERDGPSKLHDMIRFAQDVAECRKVFFAKYFSASSHLAVSAWTTDDSDALSRCGHCDNCTRPAGSVEHRDVTVEAWQILKITEVIARSKGRITLIMMSDLARGCSTGAFGVVGTKFLRGQKHEVDLDAIAGGIVSLNKGDLETLLVDLILSRYLEERLQPNTYTNIVYITPGLRAAQLTRLSREQAAAGRLRIVCSFARRDKGNANESEAADGPRTQGGLKRRPGKRKRAGRAPEDDGGDGDYEDDGLEDEEGGREFRRVITRGFRNDSPASIASDDECKEWTHSFRPSRPWVKKPRGNSADKGGSSGKIRIIKEDDKECIVLSSSD